MIIKKQLEYQCGIIANRRELLRHLIYLSKDTLTISSKKGEYWTKWLPYYKQKQELLDFEPDIHRSLLPNEIIVESDYPTYEENLESAIFAGKIFEDKGYKCHYYYSGSKSIHISIFLSNKFIGTTKEQTEKIKEKYKTPQAFFKDYIEFMREKLVTIYGLKPRAYDTQIKGTHLIRCELSRNKLGCKTLIGLTWKELPIIPPIVNEENGIYPTFAIPEFSDPLDTRQMVAEFIKKIYTPKKKKAKEKRIIDAKLELFNSKNEEIEFILSDEFKKYQDGFNRAIFILFNWLKQNGTEETELASILHDWNERMGYPINTTNVDYILKYGKQYTITPEYINKFLKEVQK